MADFAIIMGAALVGGLFAYRLKLPLPLGYILAGILVGPYSLELVHDIDMIDTMASVGVVLLLFTLGMEFSIADLKKTGQVGLIGGVAQILLTALLGLSCAIWLFKWSLTDATFFAFLIALSSTAVVLKILVDRGEVNTPHGRILIAILLVQDLAVLPLMVILPAMGENSSDLLQSIGITLGKTLLSLGAMAIIGFWIVPRLLGQTAGTRSRELFLITILAICLGAAYGTSYFGASAAFGAFAAGMLVSRSHFAHQALADIVPFRNAFVALFFVSLGMLGRPSFMVDYWGLVLLVALFIIISKFLVAYLITRFAGYSLKTAFLVGAGLAQVGEFSFVIGQAGLETEVISHGLYSLILSSAIITILFTPLAFKLAEMIYAGFITSDRFNIGMGLGKDNTLTFVQETLANHVIICGHGRTGSNLAGILRKYNIPYVVVEINPLIVSELRAQEIPCIFGDAGNHQILSLAHIKQARALVLTCPDPMAEMAATRYAREVNPNINIIAVSHDGSMTKQLLRSGVSETIEPAFEASLEFVRHVLSYYNVESLEIERIVCPFLREREAETIQQSEGLFSQVNTARASHE